MERKFFIVGNPGAGKKRLKQSLNELRSFLDSEKLESSFFETQLDATHPLAIHLDDSFTDIVIIGGDGTLNEAVNALNKDLPISIIPAGTGNDFVKNIKIGSSRKHHFETAVYGMTHQIDIGVCNGRKFLNGVGVGFDGQIVEDMASKRVPLLTGFAAYYYHVLRILSSYRERPFTYSVDDKPFKNELILLTVANGTTFGGGFKLTPDAKVDDGLLDICEIGKLGSLRRFLNIHRLSNGSHGKIDVVNLSQASSIKIEDNSDLFGHIDGERLGQPPFEIGVLPKSLKLKVSSDT